MPSLTTPSFSLPATRQRSIDLYRRVLTAAAEKGPQHLKEAKRRLTLGDLFFLLCFVLKRKDVNRDWLFDRCREVQADPNGCLDLWAREHYKSTIITFALTIQDILRDPDITCGIFSFTRPGATAFLRQIKTEFETNEDLKTLFDDVLWSNPEKEAPKWSEDGLIVKRKTNPKEATVEAWGVVEGQPTGRHFRLMIYDDMVTLENVTNPDAIRKTTSAWELSRNLGSEGGMTRYIGTRYHYNDTYHEIMLRGAAKPRIYKATADGTMEGPPVLLSPQRLADQRRDMGPFTFGCQMLQEPTADKKQGFDVNWLAHYSRHNEGAGMNKYILVDPASSKKKQSDYTSMWVIGLSADQNYYALDMLRDRLSLTERADALFALHRRWRPDGVGYERYGMMADIEHIRDRQERENYRFEVKELGGTMPKPDRIRRLIPLFESGRILLPETLLKTDYEKRVVDLVQSFREEEYKAFPVGLHDDMLDALARILDEDMNVVWPKSYVPDDRYARPRDRRRAGSWMTA